MTFTGEKRQICEHLCLLRDRSRDCITIVGIKSKLQAYSVAGTGATPLYVQKKFGLDEFEIIR
jgi:hypothetical protein